MAVRGHFEGVSSHFPRGVSGLQGNQKEARTVTSDSCLRHTSFYVWDRILLCSLGCLGIHWLQTHGNATASTSWMQILYIGLWPPHPTIYSSFLSSINNHYLTNLFFIMPSPCTVQSSFTVSLNICHPLAMSVIIYVFSIYTVAYNLSHHCIMYLPSHSFIYNSFSMCPVRGYMLRRQTK